MYKLTVMQPVAALEGTGIATDIAPRPSSLDGKRVGLLWNRKRGGDAVLKRVGDLLQERYADVQVKMYGGSIPTPQALLDKAAEECDVVVGSSSD